MDEKMMKAGGAAKRAEFVQAFVNCQSRQLQLEILPNLKSKLTKEVMSVRVKD